MTDFEVELKIFRSWLPPTRPTGAFLNRSQWPCRWNGCEKDAICAEETMGSRHEVA